MTWIRIHFFPVRIQDPDPHQNQMDPKHWLNTFYKIKKFYLLDILGGLVTLLHTNAHLISGSHCNTETPSNS